MDALQMLREDHRKVRELFRQFEEAQDKATKQAAAEMALVELNVHAILEEEIFYPAVRRQGNGSGQMVRRAEQEHHTAEQLMDELMKMEPGNADFDAKFHVLIENVKKHIEEEEVEMLPQAAEVGMARLERLGKQMAKRKESLMRAPNGRGVDRTRASTTLGARSKSTSGTRRMKAAGARRTTASGTRSQASTAGAKSPARTTASRAKTTASRAKSTAKRTVKQAGTRSRTTKPRSNTGSRRSGSQSGR